MKPAPAQRCHRCGRVRVEPGGDWLDEETVRPLEVRVICATCQELLHRLHVQRTVRGDRKLIRQRERGFGPPKRGEDIWKGFRGEGENT